MQIHDIGYRRKCVVLDDPSEMRALGWRYMQECKRYAIGWHYDAEAFTDRLPHGREDLVPMADELIQKIEDLIPVTKGWRNVDDVVGAVPNVPAFLAGHPQHMRRRARVDRDTTPVRIFVDISASASVDDAVMTRRGAALLALVRLLTNHRPVELWAGVLWSDKAAACSVVWKIDTLPLDLARAAMYLADPRMSRVFCFGVGSSVVGYHMVGAWHEYEKRFDELKQLMSWSDDTVFVQKIHLYDELVSDPVGFVRRELSKYTGATDEEV